MPLCSCEIGDEIAHQRNGAHHTQFCGIDMPAQASCSASARRSRRDASLDTPLKPHAAVHTDPQLLFATRSSDQIMLLKEAS